MPSGENEPGGETDAGMTNWPPPQTPTTGIPADAPGTGAPVPTGAPGTGAPVPAGAPGTGAPVPGAPIPGAPIPGAPVPPASGPPGQGPPAAFPPGPPPSPPPPSPWPVAPVRRRGSGTYPIDVGVDVPDRIARWRPILQWILALPLYLLLYVLRIVAAICVFIGWFVALFTGELPDGLANLIAGYYRLYWRTTSYSLFLRDKYPSFALAMGYADPGDDPAWFDVQRPAKLSRLSVLLRIILVIPQLIALFFIGIVLYFAVVLAFFIVIIMGRWPDGLRDFVVGANRWVLRVDAWFWLMAGPYPPFSLT
jgi:Domain of unknown function (DUF4389)